VWWSVPQLAYALCFFLPPRPTWFEEAGEVKKCSSWAVVRASQFGCSRGGREGSRTQASGPARCASHSQPTGQAPIGTTPPTAIDREPTCEIDAEGGQVRY